MVNASYLKIYKQLAYYECENFVNFIKRIKLLVFSFLFHYLSLP